MLMLKVANKKARAGALLAQHTHDIATSSASLCNPAICERLLLILHNALRMGRTHAQSSFSRVMCVWVCDFQHGLR